MVAETERLCEGKVQEVLEILIRAGVAPAVIGETHQALRALAWEVGREFVRLRAPWRLGAILLTSPERGESAICSHGGQFEIRLPVQAIADRVGATRAYTSELIARWIRAGVLVRAGRAICIHDPAAIRKMMEAA